MGLSIQHDLPAKLVLEVNYIGRHGSHLFGGYDANKGNDLLKNGFLDAFKQLQANNFTGDSPLINQLLEISPTSMESRALNTSRIIFEVPCA